MASSIWPSVNKVGMPSQQSPQAEVDRLARHSEGKTTGGKMPNVFAEAVAMIDRLIPASQSRRRELRLGRSRGQHPTRVPDAASCIREAESIAAREWLAVTASSVSEAETVAPHEWPVYVPSWIREAEATAALEWLADGRTA